MIDTSARQRQILAATSISYIVVILDTSIVNVALESIGKAFAVNTTGLQWVVTAYTLVFASLLLSGGTSGDRWGARNIYLSGLVVFTLASALCGAAPNLTVLIIARVVQGIGAALLVPCSLTLLNHAFPDSGERTHAIGIWAGYGGAALAAGPLLGGILIDLLGWRSIFLMNIPICALGIWMVWRIGPDVRAAHTSRLDLPGQIAAIFALVTLVALLVEGPALGWHSPILLAGVAICVVTWIIFLVIEARQVQPMLSLALFKDNIFSGAAIVAMTTTLTFFGMIFVLSLYFQEIRGYSPILTGLAFLPLTAVVTGSNMVSGRWSKAHGPLWPVLVGLGCSVIGFLGMMLVTPEKPYWVLGLSMLAIGLGGGFVIPAVTGALMSTVEKNRAGIASGVLNSARQTGAALGVAIFGEMITRLHSFEAGMRAALLIAAVLSILSAVVWWRALSVSGSDAKTQKPS